MGKAANRGGFPCVSLPPGRVKFTRGLERLDSSQDEHQPWLKSVPWNKKQNKTDKQKISRVGNTVNLLDTSDFYRTFLFSCVLIFLSLEKLLLVFSNIQFTVSVKLDLPFFIEAIEVSSK